MRKIIAIVPLVAAAALSMTTSASAEAGAGGSARSALDGSCQVGEFCLQEPVKTYNENASYQWIA